MSVSLPAMCRALNVNSMYQITVAEAELRLDELLDAALAGEQVVLLLDDIGSVQLVPIETIADSEDAASSKSNVTLPHQGGRACALGEMAVKPLPPCPRSTRLTPSSARANSAAK